MLIIKPSSLGDIITAIPVLAGIRRTFPESHIAWLVTPGYAQILEGQKDLNEVILFDRKRYGRIGRSLGATRDFIAFCRNLRSRRFDWVIDLQGLFRSGFLTRVSGAKVRAGFANAREFAPIFYTNAIKVLPGHIINRNIDLACSLGINTGPDDLTLDITPEAKEFAKNLLAEKNLKKGQYFVIAPTARWTSKVYPPRLWRKVVSELSGHAPVVLTGSNDGRELCSALSAGNDAKVVNLAGETTLTQLAAVIASAGAVITCDSSANFIAPAVGTPFVTLIGPTKADRTGPTGPMGSAIVADVPCRGCLKRRCRHMTCMQMIEPEQVVSAAREAMDRKRNGITLCQKS